MLVMGSIENFLSRFLKDKIFQYYSTLPCSDFQYFYQDIYTLWHHAIIEQI